MIDDEQNGAAARLDLARVRLRRIDDRREVSTLRRSGVPDSEIAYRLGTTERQVRRLCEAAMYLGDDETPDEIILRATVDATDRTELVRTLSSLTYTFTTYAPYPVDGSRPGTWEQVRNAHMRGYLTRAEFETIRRAAGPPTQRRHERRE